MRFIAILHFFSFVAQESISDLLSEDIGFFGDSLKWMKKGPEFFSANTPRPRAKSFFFLHRNKTFKNSEKDTKKYYFIVVRGKLLGISASVIRAHIELKRPRKNHTKISSRCIKSTFTIRMKKFL